MSILLIQLLINPKFPVLTHELHQRSATLTFLGLWHTGQATVLEVQGQCHQKITRKTRWLLQSHKHPSAGPLVMTWPVKYSSGTWHFLVTLYNTCSMHGQLPSFRNARALEGLSADLYQLIWASSGTRVALHVLQLLTPAEGQKGPPIISHIHSDLFGQAPKHRRQHISVSHVPLPHSFCHFWLINHITPTAG